MLKIKLLALAVQMLSPESTDTQTDLTEIITYQLTQIFKFVLQPLMTAIIGKRRERRRDLKTFH